MNEKTINILSIDGGGYRNIISIIFLMELEIRSKRNISAMFNMVGGTSFGAIVASLLNIPTLLNVKKPKYTTKDILSIWDKKIPKIYNDTTLINHDYSGYVKMMRFLRNINTENIRYSGANK